MKFATNLDLPTYSDKGSFFINFSSQTPWNVDLYCNSISDFWLYVWALQQTLTCYLFTLTRQLFHKFLHSVLREYYIWNKIIIQAQNLHNPIFCIWESILLMDKNTMCMIMLWNPTNFEAIFLLKICNRLKVRYNRKQICAP